MKIQAAIVKSANSQYEIVELDLADLQDDEVRVRIVATGICHSDDLLRLGQVPFPLPAVLGHEGAGVVEQVGTNVRNVKVGDHVVLAYAYCQHCRHCRQGMPAACESWMQLNWGARRDDGATSFRIDNGVEVNNFFHQSSFASFTNVKEQNIIVVPKDVDLRILGPLGCGLMTGAGTVLKGLDVKAGSSIAIFGVGAVGMAAVMAAKIAGASVIVALDIHESRLEIAKELGATHIISSKTDDPLTKILEITGGKGVNYSVETTGISAVMKTSIDALALCGTVAPIAGTNQNLTINTLTDFVMSSKRMIGVSMGATIPQIGIIDLINYYKAGKFPYDKLIKIYDFSEINQASSDSLSGKTIKPILIVDKNYAA
ncbi:NAD(P)-dependent alcohol dehydrogenase [Burkholderia contaminans]|uniref:NAD(P)-dependent alcohol dehydrogenase n=1 Tax=Burkholderia contaminans TaxID=488447 RepID=UPI001CF2C607|nr:NAD(P)-dependent alcohol dehydrogenase [Burkholderia contaminans]MCA7888627.1 NAD(P)-dependent alcohol dehydrogenase [Burkholderia contaminans]